MGVRGMCASQGAWPGWGPRSASWPPSCPGQGLDPWKTKSCVRSRAGRLGPQQPAAGTRCPPAVPAKCLWKKEERALHLQLRVGQVATSLAGPVPGGPGDPGGWEDPQEPRPMVCSERLSPCGLREAPGQGRLDLPSGVELWGRMGRAPMWPLAGVGPVITMRCEH